MNTKIMIFGFFFVPLMVTTGQSWMDDDDIEEWNDSNPWDRYESWESPNDLVFDDSGNSITRHQHKTKNYNSDVWGKNHNCKWSSWKAVGGCSTACGKGVQSYTRKNCRSKKREKTETCVGWKNCRAHEVIVCNEGHKNCGSRSHCGTQLTTDTKEPFCLECGYYSSSCANKFNPGWVPLNETCNNNWNCLRSSESRNCFSITCEKNLCKENEEYQQCFKEETKRNEEEMKRINERIEEIRRTKEHEQKIMWIGIAFGCFIIPIALIICIFCILVKVGIF